MLTNEKIKEIITATAENAESLRRRPQKCGCFHCLRIFSTTDLDEDNIYRAYSGQQYSVCEYCGHDALLCEDDLGGAAPFNEETLKMFHDYAYAY